MKTFLTLVFSIAISCLAQTNIIPPLPVPFTNRIVNRQLAAPNPMTHVVSWHYTNITWSVASATNLNGPWVTETNVTDIEIKVELKDTEQFKFYRLGGPMYYGPWWDVPLTNSSVTQTN